MESFTTRRTNVTRGVRQSPIDLLPWADPYIAGLLRRHEQESRQQRALVIETDSFRSSREKRSTGVAA